MVNYIVRRLLLMIPTLIGITFLVFMLIALSPGGIGAALRAAGGQMEATSRALQEAYLEDRYGLNDPAVVQYARWLGRISPVKIGSTELVSPTGEVIRRPKPLKPPPMWRWVGESLPPDPKVETVQWPDPASLKLESDQTPEAALAASKSTIFRRADSEYARTRGQFIADRTRYEQSLAAYARAAGIHHAVDRNEKLRPTALRGHSPDPSLPEWEAVRQSGAAVMASYARALEARAMVNAVFEAGPYPVSGVGIPGVVRVAWPDFGTSFSKSQPVSRLIYDRLPITVMLNLIAFPVIYLIAIPGGMLAATRARTWIDAALGGLFVAMWSIPIVWAGVLAVGYLANREYLGWFPVVGLHSSDAESYTFLPSRMTGGGWHRGYLLDSLWHLCLPVACLVYGGFAVLSKQTRAAMLDNFNADYVRTAKAKGVPGSDIIFRHVFRNSLLPLITMFATIFPAMLAGSVIVERIFQIPGMGSLIIESIYLRDREVILANVLMIGAVNILALLLADILYAAADPRIAYN